MSHKKTNLLYISGTKEGGIGTVVSGLNQYFNHRDDFKSSSIIMDSEDSKGRRHILVRFLKLTVLFRRYKKTADIIHVHGAWTPHVLFLKYIQGIPTVVSPHGALSKVSLEKSRVKKKIVKFLYMKKAYSKAECIHALTAQEAKEIMAYGIRDIPIAIIPNGIDFNETLNFERERKKELLDLANGRRIILSLSRLDPLKGIEMLIDAFFELKKENDHHVLFIAGEGSARYQKRLRDKVASLHLQKEVFFLGDVRGNEKNTIYDVANIFVLPSCSEGFGLTVLESFRQKTPVIVTNVTPFDKIETLNCGWYISPHKTALEKALKDCAKISDMELKKMGERGYAWIKADYSLEMIYKQYEDLYLWLLHKGDKPFFVKG